MRYSFHYTYVNLVCVALFIILIFVWVSNILLSETVKMVILPLMERLNTILHHFDIRYKYMIIYWFHLIWSRRITLHVIFKALDFCSVTFLWLARIWIYSWRGWNRCAFYFSCIFQDGFWVMIVVSHSIIIWLI